jgi:hypothetical protein
MKRALLLTICALMIAGVAMADHIGVYYDASGSSCNLGPAGFNTTATLIHKFTLGATGSRFRVTFPAGSTFFGFNTPYSGVGDFLTDYQLAYGQCQLGTVLLGTIVAILTEGIVAVTPPAGWTHIDAVNCSYEYAFATAGDAYVGPIPGPWCGAVAVQSSTWGAVKALYR